MSCRKRAILAISSGLASTIASFLLLHSRGYGAGDFTWPLGGASAFIHGINPYTNPAFGPGKPYPYGDPLFYPLPALFVALPFTFLQPYIAGAVFFGLGSGLLAYAITRNGVERLPLFFSAPFFVAALVAQWSPLVTAAAFLPWLLPIAFAKPNLGLAIGVGYPNVRGFAAAVCFFAISVIVMPTWPTGWIENLKYNRHPSPVLIFPGVVLVFAAFKWRTQAGRLLLAMALVPQLLFFYDQLPLWLIPRTWRQSMILTFSSWVAYVGWSRTTASSDMGLLVAQSAIWVVVGIYLPAFALVLWQSRPSLSVVGNRPLPRSQRWSVIRLPALHISVNAVFHRGKRMHRLLLNAARTWITPD